MEKMQQQEQTGITREQDRLITWTYVETKRKVLEEQVKRLMMDVVAFEQWAADQGYPLKEDRPSYEEEE